MMSALVAGLTGFDFGSLTLRVGSLVAIGCAVALKAPLAIGIARSGVVAAARGSAVTSAPPPSARLLLAVFARLLTAPRVLRLTLMVSWIVSS